ncbi:MAG: nitroreductase family protein [Oscillospiraceae bacterium]|nr:nitroreductase family protein [Oscillospiraceae bacterium]
MNMELMELLKTRRTYRRFDQTRPVPDEVIEKIMLSQQYASSSGNSQSLRYIVVKDPQ